MTLLSLGDLAQSMILRRNMNQAKVQVQTLSQEMTSGVTSDLARHLRGDLGPLNGLNQTLKQLEGYKSVTSELELFSGSMQAALETLDGFATALATPLQSVSVAGDEASINAMGGEAKQKFVAAIGLLNMRVGDRALFSGKATDRAPLPDGATILSQLQTLVAAETTADGVRDAVMDWFDDPAGYAALYAGDDPLAAVDIGQGEDAHLNITAATDEVVATLKGLALAALTAEGATNLQATGRASLGVMAGASLMASQSARADLRADLAVTENRIAAAQTRNGAETTALEIARAKLVEVDAYEAATELTSAQTRLETIYAITSRLSSLNLASYLR